MSQTSSEKTLIVVAGPTAVGKTALSIKIARHFRTEIVSGDSRQFFRELKIGTAKPSQEELAQVKHHFIDSHSILESYDAAQFAADSLQCIQKLLDQCNYAVLCGGSGLYVKAVTEGFDDIPQIPAEIRAELIRQYEINGIQWLQERMKEEDPELFAFIDQQNPHRLIRALEVKQGTGASIASFQKKKKVEHSFRVVKIGLELPREELYERIDARMDQMIEAGLFEEARELYPHKDHNALQTVGYQEIFDYLDGQYDREEAIRLLKRNSRRYAKRQLTWFKRDPEVRWFHPGELNNIVKWIMDSAQTKHD